MNGDTKLSEALNAHPDILDYVISLNPSEFSRLRNPLMRKVMPVRITLRRIAAMVKIPEQELLDKINELAGQPKERVDVNRKPPPSAPASAPEWMLAVDESAIQWVDLLAADEKLLDPMPPINVAINLAKPGDVIGIKHKWQPQPLFDIWERRGFKFWTRKMSAVEWHIFVYKPISGDN